MNVRYAVEDFCLQSTAYSQRERPELQQILVYVVLRNLTFVSNSEKFLPLFSIYILSFQEKEPTLLSFSVLKSSSTEPITKSPLCFLKIIKGSTIEVYHVFYNLRMSKFEN